MSKMNFFHCRIVHLIGTRGTNVIDVPLVQYLVIAISQVLELASETILHVNTFKKHAWLKYNS